MSHSELEALFTKICKKKPSPSEWRAFQNHANRDAVIEFLTGKLSEYLTVTRSVTQWSSRFDWGAVNACRLLGECNAAVAAPVMIEILDDVIDEYLAYIYNAVTIALEGMGPAGLEPAWQRFERDRDNPEHGFVWLSVLASLGVRDERIPPALRSFMNIDPAQAMMLMGDYGDPALLPDVQRAVEYLARQFRTEGIDALAVGMRLTDPRVNQYIEGRESLILLRDGIPHRDPSMRAKVEALDRQLLPHSAFEVYDPSRPSAEVMVAKAMGRKIGRNDPCPCGSGKKYKRCCERL